MSDTAEPLALLRMMRPDCTACHSRELRWFLGRSLTLVVPEPTWRAVAIGMHRAGADPGWSWFCPACSEFGIFEA